MRKLLFVLTLTFVSTTLTQVLLADKVPNDTSITLECKVTEDRFKQFIYDTIASTVLSTTLSGIILIHLHDSLERRRNNG